MHLKFFCLSLALSFLVCLASADYLSRHSPYSNYKTLQSIKGIKKGYGIHDKDSYEIEDNTAEKQDKSHEVSFAVYPKISDVHYEQTNYENPLKKKKKSKVDHEEFSHEDHSVKKLKKGAAYLLQPYEEIYSSPYEFIDPLYAPISYADIPNPYLLYQPYNAINGYNPYGQYGIPNNMYPYPYTYPTTTSTTSTTTTTAAAGNFAKTKFDNSPEALMHLLNTINKHAEGGKMAAAKRRKPSLANALVPQLVAEKTLTEMKNQIAKTNQQIMELNKKATMLQKLKMQEAQEASREKIKKPIIVTKNLEMLRKLQQNIKENKLAQQQQSIANFASQYKFLLPQQLAPVSPMQKVIKSQPVPTSTKVIAQETSPLVTSSIRQKAESGTEFDAKSQKEPLIPNFIFNIQAYSPEKAQSNTQPQQNVVYKYASPTEGQQNVLYKYASPTEGQQQNVFYNIKPETKFSSSGLHTNAQVQQANTEQSSNQQMVQSFAGTRSDFMSFGVVPDVLESLPPQIVHVAHNGALTKLGNVLTTVDTQTEPKVFWTGDTKAYYTLVMTDADATPGAPTEREFLHWLVVNIPGTNVLLGEHKAPYIPPASGSKLHRYVITVYQQFGQRGFKEIPFFSKYTTSGRSFFNSKLFAKNLSLGSVVGSFFYHA